ncbi:hypothetical protein MMC30_006586 [Trapelia coarctata]|nr:hypothetical protein [Trapelia coarctata]
MEVTAKRNFELGFLPKQWDEEDALNHAASLLRHFRLHSLQSTPDAFASTYEKEVEFTPEIWLQRVQNPDALHLLATIPVDQEDALLFADETLNTARWLGMLVLMTKHGTKRQLASASPWSYNKSQKSNTSGHSEAGGEDVGDEAYYQLNGMFVHPLVRRCGLGKLLIQRALEFVKAVTGERKLPSCRVDVLVDTWNIAAVGLYKSCGFERVGEDTYEVGGSKRTALSMSLTVRSET